MSSPSSLSIEITLPNGKTYTQPTGLFINNEFVPGNSTPISVHDPSTGNLITSSIHSASRSDVDLAVSAARTCLSSSDPSSWPSLPAVSRGELLTRLANLIHRDRELLAAIDAFDHGKRYQDALEADIEESWQVFRYYAGWADKISGKTIETGPGKLCYTLQEPLGVCAQIIPWFVIFFFSFFSFFCFFLVFFLFFFFILFFSVFSFLRGEERGVRGNRGTKTDSNVLKKIGTSPS